MTSPAAKLDAKPQIRNPQSRADWLQLSLCTKGLFAGVLEVGAPDVPYYDAPERQEPSPRGPPVATSPPPGPHTATPPATPAAMSPPPGVRKAAHAGARGTPPTPGAHVTTPPDTPAAAAARATSSAFGRPSSPTTVEDPSKSTCVSSHRAAADT